MEGPVEGGGELVVVAWDAAAEEAEDVLVDEVEPEEAVAVGGSGVAQAGEDVPGRGDGEEEEGAGEGFEATPVAEFAGEGEVEEGGGDEEDDGDQALGEDSEGQGCPQEVGVEVRLSGLLWRSIPHLRIEMWGTRMCCSYGRNAGILRCAQNDNLIRCGWGEGLEEAVEGCGEEEGEEDVWDEDAGEEEDSGAGEDAKAGVEGGAFAEGLAGPADAEEHKEEDAEGLGKVGGEGVDAEETEAGGDDPVGERGFFEIAHIVDAQGDPVAGESHMTGGVGVGAVGVVEDGRGEERGEEEDEPERGEKREDAGVSRLHSGVGDGRGFG